MHSIQATNVFVDEQPVTFRGQVSFRSQMKSKPDKYGKRYGYTGFRKQRTYFRISILTKKRFAEKLSYESETILHYKKK